jgi:hypothetical protein
MAAKQMINVTALSRRLDTPRSILLRALAAGRLKPDARAGSQKLFRQENLPRIAASLAGYMTPRQADVLNEVLAAAESADSVRLRAFVETTLQPTN